MAAKEVLDPSSIGLQVHDVMLTLDGLRTHESILLDTGDYFQLETSGHPFEGTWYVIQGPPKSHNFRAKENSYLMKKATAPPGVAE